MSTIPKTKNAIITSNIAEIVENKRLRDNYTFRYLEDGTGFYLYGNEKLSVEDFNRMFPIVALLILNKGENPDRSRC